MGSSMCFRAPRPATLRHSFGEGSVPAQWAESARAARRVAAGNGAVRRGNRQRRLPGRYRPRHDRDIPLRGAPHRHAHRQPPARRRGSAVASPTWQGTQTFAFPATDDGGGGLPGHSSRSTARRCWRRTIDDWGGRCVDTTAGRPGVPLSAAVPDGRGCARRGGRQCARRRASTTSRCASPTPPGTCAPSMRRARRSWRSGTHDRAGQLARRARRGEWRQRRRRRCA